MNSILIYFLTFSTSFLAVPIAGDGVYNYNSQVCCSGAVFNTSNNLQCCGKQYVQVNAGQICCNGALVSFPSNILSPSCCGSQVIDTAEGLSCCGSQVIDTTKSQCCNNTAVASSTEGYLSCCGSQTYNSSTQVCCYQTGKVLSKPASNCPTRVYYSCCGDRLVGPNQQCCNGVVINPSTTLVTYSYGDYNATSYCCADGGIVQNPLKETCGDGIGVIAIAGPNSGVCGGKFYNTSTQICCGSKIYSNANYGLSCCGNSLYDYNHQTCCNQTVLPNTNGSGCCGNITYDYNTQICCNNMVYPNNQSSLSCCYNN